MTQDEKDLLIRDLYGRLPYGVKVERHIFKTHSIDFVDLDIENAWYVIDSLDKKDTLKPFLRSLKSMTPEEYDSMRFDYTFYGDSYIHTSEMLTCGEVVDWLNRHHFDFHTTKDGKTLIEAGLALEAPKDVYKK